jgi:hypothetical protein
MRDLEKFVTEPSNCSLGAEQEHQRDQEHGDDTHDGVGLYHELGEDVRLRFVEQSLDERPAQGM